MEETTTQKVTTVEQASPTVVETTSTKVVPPVIKTEHPQITYNKKKTLFKVYQIIWFILGVIEVILAFRMTLKAIGANPYSGFTNFIYAISSPFALPFHGIVSPTVSGSTVFEWSTIIAAIVYFVLAWGIIHFFNLMNPVTPEEVITSVNNT